MNEAEKKIKDFFDKTNTNIEVEYIGHFIRADIFHDYPKDAVVTPSDNYYFEITRERKDCIIRGFASIRQKNIPILAAIVNALDLFPINTYEQFCFENNLPMDDTTMLAYLQTKRNHNRLLELYKESELDELRHIDYYYI